MRKQLFFPLFNSLLGAFLDGSEMVPQNPVNRMLAFFDSSIGAFH
jgi:hypothetical protein